MDRRVILQLVGETMREIGMLGGLFIPLDWIFSGRPLDVGVRLGIDAVSVMLIACGILLEARNRWIQ